MRCTICDKQSTKQNPVAAVPPDGQDICLDCWFAIYPQDAPLDQLNSGEALFPEQDDFDPVAYEVPFQGEEEDEEEGPWEGRTGPPEFLATTLPKAA